MSVRYQIYCITCGDFQVELRSVSPSPTNWWASCCSLLSHRWPRYNRMRIAHHHFTRRTIMAQPWLSMLLFLVIVTADYSIGSTLAASAFQLESPATGVSLETTKISSSSRTTPFPSSSSLAPLIEQNRNLTAAAVVSADRRRRPHEKTTTTTAVEADAATTHDAGADDQPIVAVIDKPIQSEHNRSAPTTPRTSTQQVSYGGNRIRNTE